MEPALALGSALGPEVQARVQEALQGSPATEVELDKLAPSWLATLDLGEAHAKEGTSEGECSS